jgi:hypothetical protein
MIADITPSPVASDELAKSLGLSMGGGLVAFDLTQEVTVVFHDQVHALALAMQGIACHHGAAQVWLCKSGDQLWCV